MVDAIEAELRLRRSWVDETSTLYFGGGTPSVLRAEQLGRLIGVVRELWGVEQFEELTIEANPEDLTADYLAALRGLGVNRLSIGIQSFVAEHLSWMNRRHTPQQAIEAVKEARRAGFTNITVDLMYGMEWLTTEQLERNLRQAVELGVEHISAYHLTIEPRTILAKRGAKPVDDSVSEEQYALVHNTLTAAGYEHYEVSNFARNGFRAVHNSGYWQGRAYLGVGASAHSYDGVDLRGWNVSSNKLYLEGESAEYERLSPTDLHNEYLMTRLRCADGFSVEEYQRLFGRELQRVQGLVIENGFARIDPVDFLVSDSIISSLFQ